MTDRKKPRLALVIGSGSVKCASALGVLKVFERENIGLDMVVGCSGGAIYAAAIALGWSAERTIEATLRSWTPEITNKRNNKAVLQVLFPKIFKFDETFSMIDDRLVNERLQEAFGEARFADTQMPLYIAATDLYSGEQAVLSEGSIFEAVRASVSIPYMFPPYRIGERYYVDGYQTDPLPVGVAIREGTDVIVAIGFESPYQRQISSLLRYNFQLSSITSNNLLKTNYAFHNMAHHSEIVPIMPEFDVPIKLFATDKIPYVIEQGKKAIERELPNIRSILERVG